MRAIVIDDSRAMRAILGGILRDSGFEITEAANRREALERQKACDPPPQLALLDWNMPEMNGLEFLQAVRANRANDAMRILMVSTESEMSQLARALEAGANEYVLKPFTRDVSREKLKLLRIQMQS